MPKTSLANDGPTRERILRSTIGLIAEVGADRLRTRAVADRAGVNPALVHYHFGSMSALITAAVDTVMAEETQPFVEALERGPSLRAGLEALFEAMQGVGDPTPGFMVSIDLLTRATRDPEVRSRVARMLREFRDLILGRLVRARESGEIDPGIDLTAAASLIAGLFDGLGMHRLIDPGVDVRVAAEPLMTALFGPKPARRQRRRTDD